MAFWGGLWLGPSSTVQMRYSDMRQLGLALYEISRFDHSTVNNYPMDWKSL